MNIRQSMACGLMSVLCLSLLLATTILPAEAGGAEVLLIHGKKSPSGPVQPGVPQGGRPLYSPPVFMDRGPPISERPLAPIGGGAQVVPGAAPFAWCHGEWVRIDHLRHSCPSR
jgi:hypothetical protein